MSDFNSSLPVRTESPGDIISKIADATTPSQQLAISAAGEASVKVTQPLPAGTNTLGSIKITDGTNILSITAAGEATIDMTSSAAFGSATGGTAGSKSDLVGGIYNSAFPTLTNGQQASLQLDSSGRLVISPLSGASTVTVTNLPTTVDTNYGAVGASTLRSASQVGNATGAADFNAGATGAQTLRVTANQGTANATPWNENIAQISGASPSAANALPVQITTGASFVSATNPLPVIIDPAAAGTPVNDYKQASTIAAGSSDNHDYTVTALKTLYLQQILGSAAGKAKMLVSIETGVATGVFTSRFVEFNSTATPNMPVTIPSPIQVAAGVKVRIVMTNRDNQSEDLYSTISGYEV